MKAAIIMMALLLTSMFAFPMAMAHGSDDHEFTVSLDSDNPGYQFTVHDVEYTLELVAASDNSATIRVTDENGNSDQKEISEDSEKTILGLKIELEDSNEDIYDISAVLEIELEDSSDDFDDDSDDSDDDNSNSGRGSDKKPSVSAESASLAEIYAEAGLSLTEEDEAEIELDDDSSKVLWTVYFGRNSDADIKAIVVQKTKIEEGDSDKIVLYSDTKPSTTVTVDGKTYTVELVSASDTSATIRVTDSAGNSDMKEISEDSEKEILGLEIEMKNADETNFRLSAEFEIESDDVLRTENKFRGRLQVDETMYVLKGEDSLSNLEFQGRNGVKGTADFDLEANTLTLTFEDGETVTYKLEMHKKILRHSTKPVPGASDLDDSKDNSGRGSFWKWFNSRDKQEDNSNRGDIVASAKAEGKTGFSLGQWLKSLFSRSDSNSGSDSDDNSDSDSDGSTDVEVRVPAGLNKNPTVRSGANVNVDANLGLGI